MRLPDGIEPGADEEVSGPGSMDSPPNEAEGTQCMNSAIRMMIGIGTPRKNSRIERMVNLLEEMESVAGLQYRSRRRPP